MLRVATLHIKILEEIQMSTVREMSEEYLKTAYELCVFLRLHSHPALGERIMTTAVDLSTLSHTTWAYYGSDGFIGNLVKTYETADKLMHLISVVEYLELDYSGFDKVKQDTEAIYKMSRSSINTLHSKSNGGKKDERKSGTDSAKRPTQELKDMHGQGEQMQTASASSEAPAELPVISDEGEGNTTCSSGLPFEIEEGSGGGKAGEDEPEAVEESA